MVKMIFGEDSFLVMKQVDMVKEAFRKVHLNDSEIVVLTKPLSWDSFQQEVRSQGLFTKQKLVIVRDVLESIEDEKVPEWEKMLVYLGNETQVLFVDVMPLKDARAHPLIKTIQAKRLGEVQEVVTLTIPQLEAWVVEETRIIGGILSRSSATKLVALVGNSTWQLFQELQKLVAYASGKEITPEMVVELVHATFEEKIFDFIDAVSRKDAAKAAILLQNERAAGTADMYILSMLTRQVRILIQVRNIMDRTPKVTKQDVATELGLHPYVAEKALSQARAFPLQKLLLIHDLLFELDQKTKRGMDAGLAVEQIMMKMVNT